MISKFNSFQTSIIWKAIPVVTGLAFLFGLMSSSIHGIGGSANTHDLIQFTDASQKNAGITFNTFNAKYQEKYRTLLKQLGQEKFEQFLAQPGSEDILRQVVLQELIQDQTIFLSALEQGIRIPNSAVIENIRNTDYFKTNGQFDVDKFKTILAQSGIPVNQYYGSVERQLAVQQMEGLLAGTIITVPKEVKSFINLALPTATYVEAHVNSADFTAGIKPTEEQLQTYYNQNKSEFIIPANTKLSYIIYTNDKLLQSAPQPTEIQLRQYYDANKETKFTNNQYNVSDIVLSSLDEANQIEQRLNNGENFGDLASQYSTDIASKFNQGSLGNLALADLPPSISAVVKNLRVGTYSQPIKADDGYHIVKLNNKQLVTTSFAEAKPGILKELAKTSNDSYIKNLNEKITDIVNNGGSIQDVSNVLNLPITTTPVFNQGEPPAPLNKDITKLVFNGSIPVGTVSSPQPFGKKIIIVQVESLNKQTYKPFKSVRAEVTKQETIKLAQARQIAKLQEVASKLNSSTLSPSETAKLLKDAGLTLSSKQTLPFFKLTKDANPPYFNALFSYNYNGKPTEYLVVPADKENQVYLLGVKGYSTTTLPANIEQAYQQQVSQLIQGQVLTNIFKQLENNLGVKVNYGQLGGSGE